MTALVALWLIAAAAVLAALFGRHIAGDGMRLPVGLLPREQWELRAHRWGAPVVAALAIVGLAVVGGVLGALVVALAELVVRALA